MSNFGENKTTSQIYHENQTGHYGINSSAVPHMTLSNQNTTQSKGQAIHRKPVGSGSTQQQNGPYPAVSKSSVPARKPVGGDRTKPTESTTKTQPQSSARANRSAAADLNKALPRIPNNATAPFIARDPTGKFDQLHKTAEGRAPQAPIGSTQRVDLPPLAKAQLASLASPASRPTTPKPTRQTTSRPGSSRGGPKRTSSGLSGFFSPSGSRRGSLVDAAKSVGKWTKSKADILSMNRAERDSFMKGAIRSREVEAARRADPSSRPPHQQEMIVKKQKASHPGEAWGSGPAAAAFAAQMEELNFRKRTAAAYQKRHEQDCAAADLEGRPRPPTPDAAKYSPPAASLTSLEREGAPEFDQESEVMMLTMTEKIALQLSRKLDAFKSSRKDSDCSDMDFGMTDTAPAGAIQFCGEMPGPNFQKGCHMPSRTHLKNGLCEACYAYKKNAGQ
jgi:hypothetical protein